MLLGCLSFRTFDNGLPNYELLDKIIASKPIIKFSVKEIPKNVLKTYKRKYHLNLNLSNPGSPYNEMDVVYKNESHGMLLFFGIEKDNVGFVLYESKGVYTQSFFIYFELKNGKVTQMEDLILKGQPKSFDEVNQLLVDKKYL